MKESKSQKIREVEFQKKRMKFKVSFLISVLPLLIDTEKFDIINELVDIVKVKAIPTLAEAEIISPAASDSMEDEDYD